MNYKKIQLISLLFVGIMLTSCNLQTEGNLSKLNESKTITQLNPPDGSKREMKFISFLWKGKSNDWISYDFELDGGVRLVENRSSIDIQLKEGVHQWRVKETGSKNWSPLFTFEILPAASYQENERTVFFDEFIRKTMIRRAWYDKKWKNMGTTFENELETHQLRAEFSNADSRQKMLRAIHRLNNIRKDHHLKLKTTSKLIKNTYAPIKFLPDLEDEQNVFFFAANFSKDLQDQGVNRGDKLIAINDFPVSEYLWLLEPYMCASTKINMNIREFPEFLNAQNELFGSELYANGNQVSYILENQETGDWYKLNSKYEYASADEIPFLFPKVIAGSRSSNEAYYKGIYEGLGFTCVFDNHLDAALYLKKDERLAVVEWYDLEDTENSIRDLMLVAKKENALDFDVVIDAMFSSGGGGSEYVVQAFTDAPFKTTFGNVRIEDVVFTLKNKMNHGPKVEKWIEDGIKNGLKYTTNEPFKLRNFPVGSDGVMEPAKVKFNGKKVMLFFPWGGSNLDQFAAMVADNPQTGIHTMGMSMGGYSNTWEWEEELNVPLIGEVKFKWNIGHTIRPNGEVLEGNPAPASEWIPFTRANFDKYQQNLIQLAFKSIGH